MATVLELDYTSPLERAHSRASLNHCDGCGAVSYTSEEHCRRCGGDAMEQLPSIGEVFSYTTVQQGASSFVLALVELSGGKMVTAQIVGLAKEARIGMPVELAQEKMSNSRSGGLLFTPLLTDCAAK